MRSLFSAFTVRKASATFMDPVSSKVDFSSSQIAVAPLKIKPGPAEAGNVLPIANIVEPDLLGVWRNQLIWICTVCHSVCEYESTNWIK